MKLWELAFRELSAHKKRTILTASILSAAIAYYIVFDGMLKGLEVSSVKNFISLISSDIRITSEDFDEDNFRGLIGDPHPVDIVLDTLDFVVAYTHRIKLRGFLDNSIDQYPAILIGIDPVRDRAVFSVLSYASAPPDTSRVLVGKELARTFGLRDGDYVFINFTDVNGSIVSIERKAVIIDAPDPSINNSAVFMDINDLKKYGKFGSSVTEIDVRTVDYRKVDAYGTLLAKTIGGVKIETWKEAGSDFLMISKIKQQAQGVFVFFIILIGIIGTANTILISVYERMREIGTLKAIGMTDEEIRHLFLMQGVIIGTAGSIVGVILGAAVNWYLVVHGINWTALIGNAEYGYHVLGTVHSVWSPGALILSLLIGPFATGIASISPARKAARMMPAECLRWL